MQVFGRNDNLKIRAERLAKLVTFLTQLKPAVTASALAGLGLLIVLLVLEILGSYTWVLSLVAGLCLLALLLPHWGQALADRVEQVGWLMSAEDRLITTLSPHLDDSWQLHLNLPREGEANAPDVVLVSAVACVVGNYVAMRGTYQNNADKWLRRGDDGEWQRMTENPTVAGLAAAKAFTARFELAVGQIIVGLLWAGDGLLLHDAATLPLWLLNQLEPFIEILLDADTLDPDQVIEFKQAVEACYTG